MKPDMLDCPSGLNFSETHADKRLEAASSQLGADVVKRVLAMALFVMGARREDIALSLSMPLGTLLSFLRRFSREGLPALEDRRQKQSDFLPAPPVEVPSIEVASSPSGLMVSFGLQGPGVALDGSHPIQTKVFLLTLVQQGLLSSSQVARLLGYSPAHTARLVRRLADGDVEALLDKRRGQQKDYRVTAQVKAELIQQFALDIMTLGKTSAEAISSELKERCQISIPARTVRHHLVRMGLPGIGRTLPELVAEVKKTSSESS